MAIAFDKGTNSGAINSGGTIGTLSVIVGTASNMGLIASFHTANQGGTITSMTYNGVALTQVASVKDAVIDLVSLHYLKAPASGTHNLVYQMSGSQAFYILGVASFSGLDQTGGTSAIEAVGTAIGVNGTATVNLTTISNQAWYYAACMDDPTGASGAMNVHDGQTEVYNLANAGGEDADGYKGPFAANSAHTPSWTVTSTGPEWAIVAVSLKPAASGTFPIGFRSLLGVGV